MGVRRAGCVCVSGVVGWGGGGGREIATRSSRAYRHQVGGSAGLNPGGAPGRLPPPSEWAIDS